jgi:hypothetical protein
LLSLGLFWRSIILAFIWKSGDVDIEYYQLGTFGTEAHCNKAKAKAEVMVKNVGQAVTCFAVGNG